MTNMSTLHMEKRHMSGPMLEIPLSCYFIPETKYLSDLEQLVEFMVTLEQIKLIQPSRDQ